MADRIVIVKLDTAVPERDELKIYRNLARVVDSMTDYGWLHSGNVETVLAEVPTERLHP